MEFSRQETWNGLPFSSLADPGIEPGSPTWQAAALPTEPPGKPKLTFPVKIICVFVVYYFQIFFLNHFNIFMSIVLILSMNFDLSSL